jgi:hypothetical protein
MIFEKLIVSPHLVEGFSLLTQRSSFFAGLRYGIRNLLGMHLQVHCRLFGHHRTQLLY